MAVLNRITEPGSYGDAEIQGNDRDQDIGILVDVGAGNVAEFDHLEIAGCFVGLVHVSGELRIGGLRITDFGGDAVNLRAGDVYIYSMVVTDNNPTRPYDQYHQDAVQAYSTDGSAIANVVIPNVHIVMTGAASQAIACTENCPYQHWQIGTESLYIEVDYHYSLLATNMDGLVLGCDGAVCSKPIRIQDAKRGGLPARGIQLVGLGGLSHVFDAGCEFVQYGGESECTTEAQTDVDEIVFSGDKVQQAVATIEWDLGG